MVHDEFEGGVRLVSVSVYKNEVTMRTGPLVSKLSG
jgi:hypothetical protein